MGTGQRRNTYVVKEASLALHNMKYEIAQDLNNAQIINTAPIQGDYWGYMTAKDCGHVGGQMVKNMILAAERTLSDQAVANVQFGFNAGLGLQKQNDTVPNSQNLDFTNLDNRY
ncbi:MAG TPA: alpha/beta-type small acid-soluble spore protein [Bacillota bacterium]